MPKRPIILFDVMETLVTEPFFTTIPGFFGMSLGELLETKHPTSWIEFEKGRITEDEYVQTFFRDGRVVDGAGLRACLLKTYEWLDGMEHLVAELHGVGYELHALSNYPIWYELIEKKLKLARFLKWTFVSCKIGLRKPDMGIFHHAAESLQVPTSDCLFVDDRVENVKAANAAGMDTILMTGATECRKELVLRDLLCE